MLRRQQSMPIQVMDMAIMATIIAGIVINTDRGSFKKLNK
jgi:hypothetical protein